MPERSSSIRMSRRSSLAGFRRSVTENPETSELLPNQWEGGLDAICILVGPKMSDPPLEGGVVWIHHWKAASSGSTIASTRFNDRLPN